MRTETKTEDPTIDPKEELRLFRDKVSCSMVLEQDDWRLDGGRTSRSSRYKRGPGEVLIVNHGGLGWWDPQSEARGDVITLVQHLHRGMGLGQVRAFLRPYVGMASAPHAHGGGEGAKPRPRDVKPARPVIDRWNERPRLRWRSATWRYLTGERGLPGTVLEAADRAGVLREGHRGSAWFAHQDDAGAICHVELRGPDIRTSLRGGTKMLFRLPGGPDPVRLALTEAPIDALSLAAIEGIRGDTLYLAAGGGIGPGTVEALRVLLRGISGRAGAVLVGATDADEAGDRYAEYHAEFASDAGIPFARLRPMLDPEIGDDWNDVLRHGGKP